MAEPNELSDDQRRQLVDARQVFAAWRAARVEQQRRFRGSMRWLNRRGTDYLHRKIGDRERSLGPRSAQTEQAWRAFQQGRAENRELLKGLSARLDVMAPVNRAHGLGRVPRIAARILRNLDKHLLLGQHLLLVGTNALFAYESRAGVFLGAGLLATGDTDLLWDARQRLALVLSDVRSQGVLGLLKRTDRSFRMRSPGDFRAFNKDGYWVDLIRPEDKRFLSAAARDTVGGRTEDLHGSPIHGLQWLVSAPRFEEVAIGADGYPVRLVTVDPRAFALHKLWLAGRADREPVKTGRDRAQAEALLELSRRYLGMSLQGEDLRALPQELRSGSEARSPGDNGALEPGW